MTKKQFSLRLDPRLYSALERWAAEEFRSVNAHIEFLLREAVRKVGRLNYQAGRDMTDGEAESKSKAEPETE